MAILRRFIIKTTIVAILSTHCFLLFSQSGESPNSNPFKPYSTNAFHFEIGYNANFNGRAGGGVSFEPKYIFADNLEVGVEISHRNFAQLFHNNTDIYADDKVTAILASFKQRFKDGPVTPYLGFRVGMYKLKRGEPLTTQAFATGLATATSLGVNVNTGFYFGILNVGIGLSRFEIHGGNSFSLNLGLRF